MNTAIPLSAFVASIPIAVLLLLLLTGYAVMVRWRFRADMLPDALLLGLLAYQRSLAMLAWVATLITIRHTLTLARDLAQLLRLVDFDGWTTRAVIFALPALRHDVVIMSNAPGVEQHAAAPEPVHVPVLGTAVVSDKLTTGDIIKDEWIDRMARALDHNGRYFYSANDIFKANGGHRATVMAMVKAIQSTSPPAQFRQDSGGVAPPDYPVTKA